MGKNEGRIKLNRFLLENIDEMREQLMLNYNGFNIFSPGITPYSYLNQFTNAGKYTTQYNQEGLGIRTYKSDIFNNWLNAEQINAINETSAIAVLNDKITIDQIILQKKIFELLNRIAVSGGTYQDYIESVYDTEFSTRAISPVYQGGLIKNVVFQEVISNSETENQPLGQLAGRGLS